MKRKTALITTISILLLLGVGLFSFYFFYFVPTQEGREPGISGITQFFPFGNSNTPSNVGDNTNSEGNTDTNGDNIVTEPIIPALRKIFDGETAGATIWTTEETLGTSTVISKTNIRYMERATGHISDTTTDSLVTTKVSNTTVPKVYQAWFTPTGTRVVGQYLNTNEGIVTFHGKVNGTQITPLTNTFLPNDISATAISSVLNSVFYITDKSTGARGTVLSTDKKSTSVFASPYREWIAQWPSRNTIALTTKPSASAAGHLYFLNPSTGAQRKVLGDIAGLTTLTNPTAEYVLYSVSTPTGITLRVYNVTTGAHTNLGITTFPEKCVWSERYPTEVYCSVPESYPSAQYPDHWYQGVVSFDDTAIWMLDVKRDTAFSFTTFAEKTEEKIDAHNLILSPDQGYLIFTNKKDGSLWGLHLGE